MFGFSLSLIPAQFFQACGHLLHRWRHFCAAMVSVACGLACAQTPIDLAFRDFYAQPITATVLNDEAEPLKSPTAQERKAEA